jgi:CMP-N-acetylneuraminic acid synthetase
MTVLEPVVSVYVANFNYGRFIRQAITSVLAQSFRDFEVIIIDDGSTDDSREQIESFRGDPRVRIIYQENRGLIATANLGVRAARGRYVMRLDADDWLEPNALLVMVHALDAEPGVALVFPDYYYVDVAGRITGQERRHDFSSVTLLDQPAHGACALARRDCLLEVGVYSADLTCQDGVDLWLKIVERYQVRNINLPLFYYRRHGENLTEQSERVLRQRAEIFRTHADRTRRAELSVVAVIPVRGPSQDPRDLSLATLGDRPLIDWTIEAATLARSVGRVIVSSPCQKVADHVTRRWEGRVVFAARSPDTARENVPFNASVRDAVRCTGLDPDAVMELTVQFPFREGFYIDKAADALRIFDVGRVVSVLPEDDVFYQHTGDGLKSVGPGQELGLRLERELLYRQAGGIVLHRIAPSMSEPRRVGHIVVTRRAAFCVRDANDLQLAGAYGVGLK